MSTNQYRRKVAILLHLVDVQMTDSHTENAKRKELPPTANGTYQFRYRL
jgi:hypothetical protein